MNGVFVTTNIFTSKLYAQICFYAFLLGYTISSFFCCRTGFWHLDWTHCFLAWLLCDNCGPRVEYETALYASSHNNLKHVCFHHLMISHNLFSWLQLHFFIFQKIYHLFLFWTLTFLYRWPYRMLKVTIRQFCQIITAKYSYSYTTICHNICLKTLLYFCKWTVLKVLCYQNIYAEKHGRNVHIFIGDHVEWRPY